MKDNNDDNNSIAHPTRSGERQSKASFADNEAFLDRPRRCISKSAMFVVSALLRQDSDKIGSEIRPAGVRCVALSVTSFPFGSGVTQGSFMLFDYYHGVVCYL